MMQTSKIQRAKDFIIHELILNKVVSLDYLSKEISNNIGSLNLYEPISQLRRREKPSYPEQWLMKVIENENMDCLLWRLCLFFIPINKPIKKTRGEKFLFKRRIVFRPSPHIIRVDTPPYAQLY